MKVPIAAATKPNRADGKKDIKYDADFGRWVVINSMDGRYYEHQEMIKKNRRFMLANKQWDYQEDVSNFLMDTTGQSTNRIKVEMNYIQILVNSYVGTMERRSIRSSCRSFSPFVIKRKEEALTENLAWGLVAENSDEQYSNLIKGNRPIGRSEGETAQMFENYYCDRYIEAMNNLMKYTEVVNNFDLLKRESAEQMAYTGMSIYEPMIMSGDYKFNWIQTEEFFWDRSARKYDLSDAGYMGKMQWCLPTEIYERVQMLDDDILAMEAQHVLLKNDADRIPVYKSCWRDIEIDKWGYVKNEFDDIVLKKVDWTAPDEEKPRYTMSDVVSCNDLTPYQLDVIKKKKGGGKAVRNMKMEVWRFCEFVPSEYISTNSTSQRKSHTGDLVLGHGIMPYQENDVYSPFDMHPPFKVAIYLYTDGYVNSPICVAINPQRIANRIMSAMENIINNEASTGTVIAEEAIDKSRYNSLDEVQIKMKRGEPISVPAVAFGGIQNVVGKYNDSSGNSKQHLMALSQSFLETIENVTGVNYAMKGQMDTPNQLVGTMQLMIQRGSIIQERYVSSLKEMFRQMFQSVATSGKRFYINERPKLVSLAGEEGAMVIELAKGMMMEEFLAEVIMENDKQTERQFVDTTVLSLLQYQLLDQKRATELLGRASTDEMWRSAREYAKEVAEAQKQMAEAEVQQAQAQEAKTQENYDKALELENKKIDANFEADIYKADGRKS